MPQRWRGEQIMLIVADCNWLWLCSGNFIYQPPLPHYISISKNKNQNKTNRILSPSHVKKRMNLNLTVILDVKAKKQNCGSKETAFKWKIDLQSCYNSNSTTVMANMNLISVITFPASNPPNYIFHLNIYSKTSTTIQIMWKNFPLTPSFSALYTFPYSWTSPHNHFFAILAQAIAFFYLVVSPLACSKGENAKRVKMKNPRKLIEMYQNFLTQKGWWKEKNPFKKIKIWMVVVVETLRVPI